MKISLSTIAFLNFKYHTGFDPYSLEVDGLLHKIGTQLGAVEGVEYWGSRYDGIVVAKVVTCVKHPDADKLSLCTIDDGGITPDVKRGENGHVQVVCGAPNVREGLTVAWIPPGVTVPSTLGKDPFVLEVREIRGQLSNGMLASPSELGMYEDHSGILEINSEDVGEDLTRPGTEFKKLYGLDDVVIDIENKMFTHRPDCFGILGVARELAGITGQKFTSPSWYTELEIQNSKLENNLGFESKNDTKDKVPRFVAQVVENVLNQPSPTWLRAGLNRVGIRPINYIVDLTNYFMQLTAQPLHAFDYDKIKALSGGEATIFPRMAKDGEELELLGGKKIKLTKDDIVIATDKQAVALAGVMGGAATEVDENTKNVIIECATFDMYTIRRTSMRHGLFTDAATRFTKGQSPLQNDRVLAKIVADLVEAGASPGKYFDSGAPFESHNNVNVEVDFVNSRLGTTLSAEEMAQLLKNVEFEVEIQNSKLEINVPFWRQDIEIKEDVVEEIGRLLGFDKLKAELPLRSIRPVSKLPLAELKTDLRARLAAAGANELLTYSFVHGDLMDKTGQDKAEAFKLSNALSPELQYFRMSLTPSLLDKVHMNLRSDMVRRGDENQFVLFEIGKAHIKGEPDPVEPNLPKEVNSLSLVFAADDKTYKQNYQGTAYYMAKKYLTHLLMSYDAYDLVKFELLDGADLYDNPWIMQMVAPYEPKRSAVLRDNRGMIWGVVGEYRSKVKRALKLPSNVSGFEIDPLLLLESQNSSTYVQLPKFPKVQQDITLRVPANITYSQVFDLLWTQLDTTKPEDTFAILGPLSIYQAADDQDHKNMSFRLWLSAHDRTLQTEAVNNLLDKVAEIAKDKLGAERI